MRKLHIRELSCFTQVAQVIGDSQAQLQLWLVVHKREVISVDAYTLHTAFSWEDSPQGFTYWYSIMRGLKPQ
jgi:hypothetical protein